MKSFNFILILLVMIIASCKQEKSMGITLDLKNTKVIRCGSNMLHPPFSSFDNSGKAVGIEVDIVTEAVQKLGHDVEWVKLDFGSLIPAVEEGELALAVSTIGITEARKEKVDFSKSYFKTEIIALVNSNNSSSTLVSLSGTIIMADKGTTSFPAAQKQWPQTNIVSSDTKIHWTQLLSNGEIDAFIVDASDKERVEKEYNVTFSRIKEALSEEYFGIAINKSETALVKEINKVIASRNRSKE